MNAQGLMPKPLSLGKAGSPRRQYICTSDRLWMSEPRFLAVQVGDLVAVQACGDWWMGQVIHAEGGARCNANSLFQIACIDSGVIRTVNADAVVDIVCTKADAGSGTLQTTHNHGHQHQRTGQRNQESNRHGGGRQRR
jgi:hypothetical protein